MNTAKSVTVSLPAAPFSAARKLALDALMNLMIPASRDGQMPAAASLSLFDDLRELPKAVRAHFERGLDELNARAESTHGKPFAELTAAQATSLVDALRSDDPAFIGAFTLHTTARYLQDDQVAAALGVKPRAHWPEGHEVPQGDWSLLEPVRERGEIWRKG